MKRIMHIGLWCFMCCFSSIAQSENDIIFVDKILVSDSLASLSGDDFPVSSQNSFSMKDEVINYVAIIRVLHATKKYYGIEFVCIDQNGNILFQKSVKRDLYGSEFEIGSDSMQGDTLVLRLDPKPGAMIAGQRMPLKVGNAYYIKLYVEKNWWGLPGLITLNPLRILLDLIL